MLVNADNFSPLKARARGCTSLNAVFLVLLLTVDLSEVRELNRNCGVLGFCFLNTAAAEIVAAFVDGLVRLGVLNASRLRGCAEVACLPSIAGVNTRVEW